MVQIALDKERIVAFCRRWMITEMALFGSVLRDDFGPDSDVDVLVTFAEGARRTLFDLVRMQEELKGVFGREVDLVERAAMEKSRNYIRRQDILSSLETIHAT